MSSGDVHTLFALDCGATNWRLARIGYQGKGRDLRIIGEPQPAPLSSFVNRRLPAVIQLNREGDSIESIGEVAQQALEAEELRERVRDYFKPCIGSHLISNPLPHQKRFTHSQAIEFTRMLFNRIIQQLRDEKWRGMPLDDRVFLAFAYPVHWRYDHEGAIFEDFKKIIFDCLDDAYHEQIRFVSEPDGALLSLSHAGLLSAAGGKGVTLVADIGGSTSDIIAGQLDAKTGMLQLLGRYGEPHGGGLYDAELAKYLADEIGIPASVLADDPSLMVSVRESARRLKESLSRQLMVPGESLHSLQRTITLVTQSGEIYRKQVRLDARKFNQVVRHLKADFELMIDKSIESLGFKTDDVSQVILVGGGALLFTIVQHLRERFGASKVMLADNPEEIVVRGVALELGETERIKHLIAIPEVVSEDQEQGEELGVLAEDADIMETTLKSEGALDETPTGRWRLLQGSDLRHEITEQVTKLGRRKTNDIPLNDDLASRFHAALHLDGETLSIEDQGSMNGTFVNEERLEPENAVELQNGDQIRIGSTIFECSFHTIMQEREGTDE